MKLGLELENSVIDAAAALLRVEVVGRQVEVPHPERPWLVATCDALVRPETGWRFPLEVKTTSSPDGYPLTYLEAQLAVQMDCCGVLQGYSAVYNPTTGDFSIREHTVSEDTLAAVLQMADTLYSFLSEEVVPGPVFPGDSKLWDRLYPQSSEETVELDALLVDDLVSAREEVKRATVRAELLEASVKDALGDADTGLVNGVERIRWRTVASRRIDTKRLDPEVAEAARIESTVRRFTLISPTKQHTDTEVSP
jgi:predicted phage-related endonuclease